MDLGAIIPILVIVLIFGPRLFSEIKDYLLKKEKLKAEVELKAEALRLKNSLELEKFINSDNIFDDQNKSSHSQHNPSDSDYQNVHTTSTQQNTANSTINDENNDSINQRRNSQYERY